MQRMKGLVVFGSWLALSLACGGTPEGESEVAAPPAAPAEAAPAEAAPAGKGDWWVGTYGGDEIVGDVTGWTYLVLAKRGGEGHVMWVSASMGEIHTKRMKARIDAKGKSASFICEGDCVSPSGGPVKSGDVLFTLSRKGQGVVTEWGAFKTGDPGVQLQSRAQGASSGAQKVLPEGQCCCMTTIDDATVELTSDSEASCWGGDGCLPLPYEGMCQPG